MTILLDIATLFVLALALSFVPLEGMRHEARVTRHIREAQERRHPTP